MVKTLPVQKLSQVTSGKGLLLSEVILLSDKRKSTTEEQKNTNISVHLGTKMSVGVGLFQRH